MYTPNSSLTLNIIIESTQVLKKGLRKNSNYHPPVVDDGVINNIYNT